MDLEIEKAIEVGWDPTAAQELKSQAFSFLERLRSDSQGWSVCFDLFARSPRRPDVVRFVSLEIINNAIQARPLDGSSLLQLKESALAYVRTTYSGTAQNETDPAALQNKLTQTLIYLFLVLYRQGWEGFMDDFLALSRKPNSQQCDNAVGVVLYLRILSSVHDEIADVLLNRGSGSENKRNADLKDLIRDRDMHKIANSWQDILAYYTGKDDNILEMTLRVIGKWVGWIDISLVVNQSMQNLLLGLVGRMKSAGGEDKVRDAAIDAFTEIVAKKMKPADKIGLINFLNLGEIVAQLIASRPLNEYEGTPQYDHDLAEAVAKLVNTTMTDIIRVVEDTAVDNDTRAKAEQQLQAFLPLLLRLFSDEYDEICSTVIPSLTDLLTFLRKVGTLPSTYSDMLTPILKAIISKMRYDETSNWGREDEQTDEAEFQELRKRLQILQKTVATVDQDLYMKVLGGLVENTFSTLEQQGSQMNWRDVDLALYEINMFGELALPNAGITPKSQPVSEAGQRLVMMMSKMVESGIASFPHPAILLQYMEITVRYCAFFEAHTNYIPQVLENFVRLVHHDHVRIRTRSWYLFLRFIKHLRAQVGNVAETVIQSIRDLLPIKAEVPGNDADDDMSSDEMDNSADAVFNSQLYLYEAIGCVSSTASTPLEKQALYAQSVMEPLFSDMERHLPRAKSGDAQAIHQIHHIVLALGSLGTGFSDWHPGSSNSSKPPPPKAISDVFSRAAEAILVALGELNSNGEIRAACRAAFSRLLGVLGNAVLPQLPQWIDGLLSRSSSKDEMAMFLRTLEQVVYGFKGEIYSFLDLLLTPLLERVFVGLMEPINGTDDEIQMQELRREYLAFIQVILLNDLGNVLVSAANQHSFDSLVSSVINLARTTSHGNLATSKLGFNVLGKMASLWGGPDVKPLPQVPNQPVKLEPSPQAIPGFGQFMIERFHTACWEVLMDPSFKPSFDAQSKQVLGEIAFLEQVIYSKTGDAYIHHLEAVTLVQRGVDVSTFMCNLVTGDKKVFTGYLSNLVKRWKA